jgi:tRNA(Arg) A34 adenosine deaminase TadA
MSHTPMTNLRFLRQAIQIAREHSLEGEEGPFGAVVVRHGVVVGEGWNQVVLRRDPTAHAEILAIRDAATRLGTHVLEDCTIYCSCEPCPMCLAAIYWARIPRIVYAAEGRDARAAGFDDTAIARELTLEWKHRSLEAQQALKEEGTKVLEEWMENPDRVDY